MFIPVLRWLPANRRRRLRRGLGLVLVAAAGSAPADAEPSGRDLVEALRGGGYNLYFRHAQTDWRQGDFPLDRDDLASCDPEEMRQLSEEGRATARAIGAALRALGVPVGRVISSPYCRCVQTAELMDLGPPVRPTDDIMNTRSAAMFGGLEAVVERARRTFAIPPAPGTNTVMVAHGNLMRAASAVSLGEAGAAVIRPDGAGGYAVVAELDADDWQRLAASRPVPATGATVSALAPSGGAAAPGGGRPGDP